MTDKISSPPSSSVNDKTTKETTIPEKEKPVQRCSGRIVRQLIHYEHEAHVLVSDTEKDDPLNFKEAMEDPNVDK